MVFDWSAIEHTGHILHSMEVKSLRRVFSREEILDLNCLYPVACQVDPQDLAFLCEICEFFCLCVFTYEEAILGERGAPRIDREGLVNDFLRPRNKKEVCLDLSGNRKEGLVSGGGDGMAGSVPTGVVWRDTFLLPSPWGSRAF